LKVLVLVSVCIANANNCKPVRPLLSCHREVCTMGEIALTHTGATFYTMLEFFSG